jgi:hypothetical protein
MDYENKRKIILSGFALLVPVEAGKVLVLVLG